MWFKLILLIFSIDLFNQIDARLVWKNKHGSLGSPRVDHHTNTLLRSANVEEKWFTQLLDHNDSSNTKNWSQRYFVREEKWNQTGPVFLMLGGEGEATPVWLIKGHMAEGLADRFNAYLLQLEHRFYGKSSPTDDMSVDNLKYLTSEQALADVDYFVQKYKKDNPQLANVPWIVFGGSYSGSLAAWMRLLYPNTIDGAVASSGPLVALIDFEQYQDVVANSIGQECSSKMQTAINQVKQLTEHPLGLRMLTKEFSLCTALDTSNDFNLLNFYASLVDAVDGVVQYSNDNRHFEGADPINIDDMCSVMTNKSSNLVEFKRLAQVVQMVLSTQNETCLDYDYKKMIDQMRNITFGNEVDGARQWTYQTCNEFGFFQSTDSENEPFYDLFNADFYVQQCIDIFGDEFNSDYLSKVVNQTNAFYGGLDLEVDRVIMPYGSVDPWHALGAINYSYKSSESILIQGTAHCADLYPVSQKDLPTLVQARQQISDYIYFLVTTYTPSN